jgi:linoleoyl-CoA desaturase
VSVLVTIGLAIPSLVFGNVWAALALGLMRGVTSVGPGHSISHFAQFPRGNWNSWFFRLVSPFLVSSWSIWTNSHVRSHHVATLTPEDLQDNYPLKRVQAMLPHRAWHRFQHFYIWPIYLLALPLWAMQDFLESVVSLFKAHGVHTRFSWSRRLENVVAIGINLLFFVGMPFFFLDVASAALVVLVSTAVASPIVVIQIVVNHEVPETINLTSNGDSVDWGEHQVTTSHNFGVDSRIALHLSGGLNMQVEHHLFPGVHYAHYPALSRIVQTTCREFGLTYHSSAHVFEAVAKHYRALKLNSVPDATVFVNRQAPESPASAHQ